MSADNPVATLQGWAKAQQLATVNLNVEGTELSKDGVTLVANQKQTISHNDKTCEYTLASIFLQILDPGQSLPKYRAACKKHGVTDSVKASDKATVLAFFLGDQPPTDANGATTTTTVAAPIQEKPSTTTPEASAAVPAAAPADKARPPSSSSRDKHQSSKDKHRSSSKEKHRQDKKRSHSSSRPDSSEKRKKAPKMIDAEKLFRNLLSVVDKREDKEKKEADARLVAALSLEGFEVTPELLEENKEVAQSIMSNEIPAGNCSSAMQAKTGKSLKRIMEIYTEALNPPKGKAASSSSSSKSAAGSDQRKAWRSHLVGKKPIIVIPKGMTSPITMINAHEFFCNSTFVPRDVMLKRGIDKKTIPTTFQRKVGARLGGGTVEYEIMDNPNSKLTLQDWDRVVAVVCMGEAWQFKDWPKLYKQPVHLFGMTFGFYIGMEGAKVPNDLQSWAVTKSKLNRDKRGLDSVTYASFWNGLDEFMAIHKPEMLPQQDT